MGPGVAHLRLAEFLARSLSHSMGTPCPLGILDMRFATPLAGRSCVARQHGEGDKERLVQELTFPFLQSSLVQQLTLKPA